MRASTLYTHALLTTCGAAAPPPLGDAGCQLATSPKSQPRPTYASLAPASIAYSNGDRARETSVRENQPATLGGLGGVDAAPESPQRRSPATPTPLLPGRPPACWCAP